MLRRLGLAMLLLVAACSSGTFAVLTLNSSTGGAVGIKTIAVQLALAGKAASSNLAERNGADIILPTTASFEIRSGSGTLMISATALDSQGSVVAAGTQSGPIKLGSTTNFALDLVSGGLSIDKATADFGDVALGVQSAELKLAVSNRGAATTGPLSVATLGGAGASAFVVTADGCVGQMLTTNSMCTVSVAMKSSTAGRQSATLTLGAMPGGDVTSTLTGNAVGTNVNVTIDAVLRHSNSFGAAGGTITNSVNTDVCTAAPCTITVPAGSSLTLTARPAARIGVDTWMEGCSSATDNTCTLTPTANMNVGVSFTPFNYMFVTSTTQVPSFGFNGADTLCNNLAHASGSVVDKNGTYRAWLSSSAVGAKQRLGNLNGVAARGWIRPDGVLFADGSANLAAATLFSAPYVTETGGLQGATAVTGTSNGVAVAGQTCNDWVGGAGFMAEGGFTGGTVNWSANTSGIDCTSAWSLYCFQVDYVVPTPPPLLIPGNGRRAFVSTNLLLPGQNFMGAAAGVPSADAICINEATMAALPNAANFKALIATTAASALTRFDLTKGAWYRVDGAPMVGSAADIVTPTKVFTSLNVHANGTLDLSKSEVWTGSKGPNDNSTVSTCADWTTTAGNGIPGFDYFAVNATSPTVSWWSSFPTAPCTSSLPVYCFED